MFKRLAQCVAFFLVLPSLLRHAVLCRLVGPSRGFSAVSEHVAGSPGLIGIAIRQRLFRKLLRQCGEDVHFGYQTLLSKPDARIGDRVYLGRFCTVGWVEIGDDARIADGAQLLSGANHHGGRAAGVDTDEVHHQPIRIGEKAWIGANAVVMADVGAGAIVGAGAVVTRPVEAGATVGGVPAKPLSGENPARWAA